MEPDEIRAVIEPVVATFGLELFDVAVTGPTLQVLVDRDGGVDLDGLTAATRSVTSALDAAGVGRERFALEMSSPGLERPLRTPAHYRWAIGATVSIKTRVRDETERRRGVLVAADDDGCTIEIDGAEVPVAFDDVVKARTVFEWGASPKPGGKKPAAKKPAAEQQGVTMKRVTR